MKYYFNNIWLPELYNVAYAQEYFYFGGLLGVMTVIEHLPLLPMNRGAGGSGAAMGWEKMKE